MTIVAVKFLLNVVTSNFSRQGSESQGRTTFARQTMSHFFSVFCLKCWGLSMTACAQSCVGSEVEHDKGSAMSVALGLDGVR